MQWEYLRVDHYSSVGTDPSYSASPADELTEAVLARDATQVVGFGVDCDYGQLNDLGALGWELVAMTPGPAGGCQWRLTGRHPADFAGLAPTGRSIDVRTREIYMFAGDQTSQRGRTAIRTR